MQDDVRANASRLPSGGLIHLQARVADLGSLLGPTWATLCGVLASNAFHWERGDYVKLPLLLLLVDGGWGTIWAALAGTDWSIPVQRWRTWEKNRPAVSLPYTLPGTVGDRLSRWMGRVEAWWRSVLWPTCGPAVQTLAVGVPLTALMGGLLGPELLLLSAAALALMEMGLLWTSGHGAVPAGWDGIVGIALPWMAGHLTFGNLTLPSTAFALLLALAWGGAWSPRSTGGRVLILTQLSAAAGLVVLQRPLSASLLLLALVPQVALLPWASRQPRTQSSLPLERFVGYTRPWLMGVMLVAALVL